MSKCPYTWVRGLFGAGSKTPPEPGQPARNLMVRVVKDGEERVLVSLPSRSAKWLIELIPKEVVEKIYAEEIPLDAIAADLNQQAVLYPRSIFSLNEPRRSVEVWLE